jgi:hypothetical protein
MVSLEVQWKLIGHSETQWEYFKNTVNAETYDREQIDAKRSFNQQAKSLRFSSIPPYTTPRRLQVNCKGCSHHIEKLS